MTLSLRCRLQQLTPLHKRWEWVSIFIDYRYRPTCKTNLRMFSNGAERCSSPQRLTYHQGEHYEGCWPSRGSICPPPVCLWHDGHVTARLATGHRRTSVPNTPRRRIRVNYLIGTRAHLESAASQTDWLMLATDFDFRTARKTCAEMIFLPPNRGHKLHATTTNWNWYELIPRGTVVRFS